MRQVSRSILYSQLVLYGGLAVCVMLKPAGLATNDGISYYGIFRETILPYAVALLGAAYFLMRASSQLRPDGRRILGGLFPVFAVLIAGLVITPYAAGHWMDYLHTTCGSTLFSLQLILSGWLCWKLRYVWWSIWLSLIELAAGILSAIYLSPAHGFLLQTQVLFQLAFGILLILSLELKRPAV